MPTSDHYMRAAQQLAAQGQIGEAIDTLEKCVEECRDDAEVTKLLAKLSLEIDEVRAFQNWCHESMRIAPNDPEPHQMLAEYFAAAGRLSEAAEAQEAARRLRDETLA